MSKRRRTKSGFSSVKRPIDKDLVSVTLEDINATQQNTIIKQASTACTVTGLRWSFFVEGDAGTVGVPHDYTWAIVLVRDGNTANGFNVTDGSSYYEPEQNVLTFGNGTTRSAASSQTGFESHGTWSGTTKSMRKLMNGDAIHFIIVGIATQTVRCHGVVQLFCKF